MTPRNATNYLTQLSVATLLVSRINAPEFRRRKQSLQYCHPRDKARGWQAKSLWQDRNGTFIPAVSLNPSLQNPPQRRHAGDLPFFPHLIDHVLNMRVMFFFQMIEAPLFGDKLLDRNAPLGALARVPGIKDVAVHDLVERIDAAFDSQLAELVGVARMIVPTLWTWIVGVDEGRAADLQRLAHLVQIIRGRKGGAGGGNVTARRMADGKHAGDVLLPAPLHDRMLGSRRREGRLRAVSRRACCLDIGIGGR